MPAETDAAGGGAPDLFGLAAEFDSPEAILQAAEVVHDAGYRHVEAYTPFPVTGLSDRLGFRRTRVPLFFLIGAVVGGGGAFFMQWFANVVHYPWNVGGRPPNSWPAFIPITFEMAILFAALTGVAAMLAMNGLPRLYHPLFRLPQFARASRDRYFLCVEATDPRFDVGRTRNLLFELMPLAVMEVPK
jgi:hypothetical protein